MSDSAASSSASASDAALTSAQQLEVNSIITTYKALRAQISELANKIGELDAERGEHHLVIRTIKDLAPDRRCYRQIGGVLVERTVSEVLPAVQKNLSGLEELIGRMSEDLKKKEFEADEFRTKHNIAMGEIPQENREADDEKRPQRTGGNGVLA